MNSPWAATHPGVPGVTHPQSRALLTGANRHPLESDGPDILRVGGVAVPPLLVSRVSSALVKNCPHSSVTLGSPVPEEKGKAQVCVRAISVCLASGTSLNFSKCPGPAS